MAHHRTLSSRIAIIAGVSALVTGACSAGPAAPATGSGATPPAAAATASSAATPAPVASAPLATVPVAAATGLGDPCRLLTAAEAETALGREVGSPVIHTFSDPRLGNGFDCAYNSVNQEAGPASIHVGVLGDNVPRDGWEQAERAEPDLQEVSGVGELAFFDSHNQTIDAFAQGRWIQVQMINSTRFSELLPILTDVIRNAIARI